MKVLTIRNVPEATYQALVARAQRNRRSLQQEALLLIERVRGLEKLDNLDHARDLRRKLKGRELGDTVSELRDERNR